MRRARIREHNDVDRAEMRIHNNAKNVFKGKATPHIRATSVLLPR